MTDTTITTEYALLGCTHCDLLMAGHHLHKGESHMNCPEWDNLPDDDKPHFAIISHHGNLRGAERAKDELLTREQEYLARGTAQSVIDQQAEIRRLEAERDDLRAAVERAVGELHLSSGNLHHRPMFSVVVSTRNELQAALDKGGDA